MSIRSPRSLASLALDDPAREAKVVRIESTLAVAEMDVSESFLAEVPGFKTFHLLRGPIEDGARLYASHTVWADEAAFTAWTKSEAFRKAHAQGKTSGLLLGPPKFVGWQSVEM